MKKLLAIVLLFSLILACNNDDNANANVSLVGTWKLTETLVDPGDGSGTFIPVQSNKTVTFNNNETFTSNGNMCNLTLETAVMTSRNYSTSGNYFTSADCLSEEHQYNFTKTGNTLIVEYPCFEPCLAKFVKVN